MSGSQECVFGSWTACLLEEDKVETRNGLDDNFNGQVDESLEVDCGPAAERNPDLPRRLCRPAPRRFLHGDLWGIDSTATAPWTTSSSACQNAVGQPVRDLHQR